MDPLERLIQQAEQQKLRLQQGSGSVPTTGPAPSGGTPLGTTGGTSGGLIQEPLGPVNNAGQVPLGAGESPGTNITQIDRNFPQYHSSVTNQSGEQIDLYKHLQVHEKVEKDALDKGASIDDAHTAATNAEKESLEGDGGSWKAYSDVIKGYLKTSEREHPAHAPPVMPQQQAGAPGQPGTPSPDGGAGDPLDALITKTQAQKQKVASESEGYLSGFNGRIADTINRLIGINPLFGLSRAGTPLEAGGGEEALLAARAAGKTDPETTRDILETAGQQFLKSQDKMIDAHKVFNALGVKTTEDPTTTMGNIGKNTFDALFTLGALQAAAPAMAEKAGMATKDFLIRSIGDAMVKHPWVGIVSEVIGGTPGATIGEKVGGPGGALTGGVIGQLVTSPFQAMGRGAMKISGALASRVRDAIDEGAAKLGLADQNAARTFTGKTALPVSVGDDILERWTRIDAKARNYGDQYVAARKEWRDLVDSGASQAEVTVARKKMAALRETEQQWVDAAEAAFDRIPERSRSKYTYSQEAVRKEAADILSAQTFAETQLQGDIDAVNKRLTDTLARAQPSELGMTTGRWSKRVADGIRDAYDMAKGIMGKYWDAVDMRNRRFPGINRELVQRDIDTLKTDLSLQYTPREIPFDRIREVRELFATHTAMPNGALVPKKPPTMEQIKAHIDSIDEARRVEMSGEGGGNRRVVAGLTRLEDVLIKNMEAAFPNDVALQQARGYSRVFNDMFWNSDIGQVLRFNRKGAPRVKGRDVLDRLVSREEGLRDVYKATDALLDHPRFAEGPQAPARNAAGQITEGVAQEPHLDRAAKDRLLALRSDIENGLRSQFADEVKTIMQRPDADPEKAAKHMTDTLNKWNPRITEFSKVAGEMQGLLTDLSSALQARRAMEESAMMKHFRLGTGVDAEAAINKIFASSNSPKLVRGLINGEAGVGGFVKDPIALEGFRAGLTDRLFQTGKNSPAAVTELLKDSRIARTMEEALGPDRFDRLQRIVQKATEVERDPSKRAWVQNVVFAARWAALKFHALLPNIGEGAQLQQAALFSELAKRRVTQMLTQGPGKDPVRLMTEAVRDPSMERFLFDIGNGVSPRDMRINNRTLRRVLRMDAGVHAVYNAWQENGKGVGPLDRSEPMANHPQFATSLRPGDRYLSKGIILDKAPDENDNIANAFFGPAGVGKIMDLASKKNKFQLADRPTEGEVSTIDDRRLSDRTLQGYKGIVDAMDAKGLSQLREAHGFARRAPPRGIDYNPFTNTSDVPIPGRNPFRMMETRKGFAPPDFPEAGPRATGGGGTGKGDYFKYSGESPSNYPIHLPGTAPRFERNSAGRTNEPKRPIDYHHENYFLRKD